MTKKSAIAGLLLVGLVGLQLAGCGVDAGGLGSDGRSESAQPSTVSVRTGTIATDSWGYTGSNTVSLQAPSQTQVLVAGRTLLQDPRGVVVTGTSPTTVEFSSDLTTLPAAAQASAPGDLVAYVDLEVGDASTALPALQVTVDAGSVPAGQPVTVYRYDESAAKWTGAVATVVNGAGKVTFAAGKLALWGIFK